MYRRENHRFFNPNGLHNMRKIEAQMNSAIRNEVNFSKANTSVTWNDRTASVYLHGNLIARVSDTFVQILDGGWQSVTTKSRLNDCLLYTSPSPRDRG